MIVARFTPASGWSGKCISYDGGHFALEGDGLLAPQDVLRYDQLGQISWEYDGLHEWVDQLAAGTTPSPAVGGDSAQGGYQQRHGPLLYGYAADAQYFEVNKLPSPPSIAVAGFIMGILGFIFPLLVWWWVGLPLSWVGYKRAVREKLPTALALAGLIINAVMSVVSVVSLLLVIVLIAVN